MVRLAIILLLLLAPSVEAAQPPTLQQRFAVKRSSIYAHALGTTHIRNDFYNTFGLGLDLGGYVSESVGFEARGIWLNSTLSDAGRSVQEQSGLTPDTRPQDFMVVGGVRWSFGYGKILIGSDWVSHFDPQLTLHAGATVAEARTLPTVLAGMGVLVHFRYGVQAKLDLAMATQVEDRTSGSVVSFSFMPTLGIGWAFRGLQ